MFNLKNIKRKLQQELSIPTWKVVWKENFRKSRLQEGVLGKGGKDNT
jgi:hypothetical protein